MLLQPPSAKNVNEKQSLGQYEIKFNVYLTLVYTHLAILVF